MTTGRDSVVRSGMHPPNTPRVIRSPVLVEEWQLVGVFAREDLGRRRWSPGAPRVGDINGRIGPGGRRGFQGSKVERGVGGSTVNFGMGKRRVCRSVFATDHPHRLMLGVGEVYRLTDNIAFRHRCANLHTRVLTGIDCVATVLNVQLWVCKCGESQSHSS